MPPISQQALARALRDRSQGSVFFFHGDEEYLREALVDRAVAAYLDPTTRDFNFDQLRGADASADALASLLATPPMMAEWRVVVLREAQGLSVKAREVLEAVVSAPEPGLALVVTATIPSASKARFYDNLQKKALSVECAAMDPLEAPGWVIDLAQREHGVEVEVDAARALVAGIGVDLGTLSSEVEKLIAYAGDRKTVTLEDVKAVGGTLPKQDRWAWFDLVAERRFAEALAALPVLVDQGESGVSLVIGMGSQLLRVALVVAGGQAALERELKPFQRWMAKRIVPTARRWTLPEIDAALEDLLRTDRLLKSASLNDRQALEELLLRMWGAMRSREAA
ncbi:MAG: polymerase delta subunit [Gemmatimonadetes bacterium]|nr:polymerase delta subunit [Gemmatimonadota bacterium]